MFLPTGCFDRTAVGFYDVQRKPEIFCYEESLLVFIIEISKMLGLVFFVLHVKYRIGISLTPSVKG